MTDLKDRLLVKCFLLTRRLLFRKLYKKILLTAIQNSL